MNIFHFPNVWFHIPKVLFICKWWVFRLELFILNDTQTCKWQITTFCKKMWNNVLVHCNQICNCPLRQCDMCKQFMYVCVILHNMIIEDEAWSKWNILLEVGQVIQMRRVWPFKNWEMLLNSLNLFKVISI
jgi:hypothetical protein